MKRWLILLLVLVLLSVSVLSLAGVSLSRQKDQVTLKERVIYGDVRAAEGLLVEQNAHYDSHLFWQTSYQVGTGVSRCDYDFSLLEHHTGEERRPTGLSLGLDLNYGVDLTDPDREATGLQKAYLELYEATAPGSKGTKQIRLQDYYTHYPIQVSVELPGVVWSGLEREELSSPRYESERTVWEDFNSFFKIPVPEELPAFSISVTRDERGNSVGIGTESPVTDFYLTSVSTYNQTTCFFSIGNRLVGKNGPEGFVNTDGIPGGYGIYAFDYEQAERPSNTLSGGSYADRYVTGVDSKSLRMVYPLEREVQVTHLTVSSDGSRLLVFTWEQEGYHLTVLDAQTMAQLQRIEVSDEDSCLIHEQDGFLVLDGNARYTLLEEQTDGTYDLVFSVEKGSEVNPYAADQRVRTPMAYDGRRLAVVDCLYEPTHRTIELCSFYVAVYDKSGLLYYGEYDSSLSMLPDTSNYGQNCLPTGLTVTWRAS